MKGMIITIIISITFFCIYIYISNFCLKKRNYDVNIPTRVIE